MSQSQRVDPTGPDFLKTEDKIGGPTNLLVGFDAVFELVYEKLEERYARKEDHPLYRKLLIRHLYKVKQSGGEIKRSEEPVKLGIPELEGADIEEDLFRGEEERKEEKKEDEEKKENEEKEKEKEKEENIEGDVEKAKEEVDEVKGEKEEEEESDKEEKNSEEGGGEEDVLDVKKQESESDEDPNLQNPSSPDLDPDPEIHNCFTKEEEEQLMAQVQNESNFMCDDIFAKYLDEVAQKVNAGYYQIMIKFVCLFRECLNEYSHKIRVEDTDKKETENGEQSNHSDREHGTEYQHDYCSTNNAEQAPEISNEFVTIYLEEEVVSNIDRHVAIQLTQNLCHWLFINGYTTSKLSLIQQP